MTPLAWLITFLLPACGAQGAGGLPRPVPMDVIHIERPATPNTALAAPEDFKPAPDILTPVFPVGPARLYQAVLAVAAAQPRTFIAAAFPGEGQAHFVVRSAWFNFPDLVTAQIGGHGQAASTLILYSRSVYGYSDLGVNRRRLKVWLGALQATINQPDER
jgi:uncharacterized protein (DUF1499 family)